MTLTELSDRVERRILGKEKVECKNCGNSELDLIALAPRVPPGDDKYTSIRWTATDTCLLCGHQVEWEEAKHVGPTN